MFLPCAVCEHAYSLAQNLDPNSEGQGVLQFKTGSNFNVGNQGMSISA
jgi:callose synthase